MQTNIEKTPNQKSRLLTFLENASLLIVLGLITLRATYIESPHTKTMQSQFFLSSEIVSLLLSTVLLGCFAVWLIVMLLMNQLRWRKTWLGWGIGLFVIAGTLSFFAASNKRAAITDLVLLVTPMVSAVFLIQLITSKQKIRLALLLVLAVGVAATAQCIDQMTVSNEAMIQNYEQNPAEQIEKLGVEPDSLEHWMYEHRLYSKDIRGFLMTSNSAASFFILTVFAAIGLCMETFRERKHLETLAAFVCYSLAFLLVLSGLVLTQSKGGIGAFIFGFILLMVIGLFGKRLWKHRIAVGILLLAGVVLASTAIAAYGLEHGKLPGGNSMLVRWQYWQSTANMIGDHFLTGVGGANFSLFYPLYKNAAASETVQDPHNVILSLLSQYGPLGLLAFLAAIGWPVRKCLQQRFTETNPPAEIPQPSNRWLWVGALAVSLCMLLFLRPLLMDTDFLYQSVKVRSAAYVILYLFPAGIFVMAFGLLVAVSTGDISAQKQNGYLTIALTCGLIAVLIHNMIDFAIFEPGVWNTFWLFIALLIAINYMNHPQDDKPILLAGGTRMFMILGFLIAVAGYFTIAVVPPMKANLLFRKAVRSGSQQDIYLENAVAADALSPDMAYNAARLLMRMHSHLRPEAKGVSMLDKASGYANVAQQRNPAGFKPYRLKGEIELALFEEVQIAQKTEHLQNAYKAFSEAMNRYPGSDRIHYSLGQIAEELNQPQKALRHYQQALEIEMAYQKQFKMMYPGRDPVISRMGNTAYTIARAKIEELQKQLKKQTESLSLP